MPGQGEDRDALDYWLRIWSAVYRALLAQPEDVAARQTFVDYDALCAAGGALEPRLRAIVGAEQLLELADLAAPAPREGSAGPEAMAEAAHVHALLRQRFLATFA